jgi:hypothetical protein
MAALTQAMGSVIKSVQRGTWMISSGGSGLKTLTISAVNPARSVVTWVFRVDEVQDTGQDMTSGLTISSGGAALEFTRGSDPEQLMIFWQVIEYA